MTRHEHWIKTIPTSNEPHPMKSDHVYTQTLEQEENQSTTIEQIAELEEEFKFKYRSVTGELVFALVTCRPDISFPVIKLCQYNACPGRLHFEAVKQILVYLRDTIDDGMYYWREYPNKSLPYFPPPPIRSEPYERTPFTEGNNITTPFGIVDSDWASDTQHRHSVSGMGCMYGGCAIAFKTAFQKAVSLSSTEAEFYALVEGGKMLLYLRSILEDLGIEQLNATSVYEDNQGCLQMVNTQQPTKRMRHVDTKQYCILDWVETDLLNVKRVGTHDNSVDVLTKALPKALFHRHNEILMGKVRPQYCKYSIDK